MKAMKSVGRIVGVLVLLAFAGLAAFVFLFDANQFRPTVEAALTRALHRQTQIGKLNLSVFHGRVEADSLSVAEDPAFGNAPFIQAKSVGLQVELWSLILQRKLNVTGIVISEPAIALLQDKQGIWNFATLAAVASGGAESAVIAQTANGSPNDLSIKELHVSNGRLILGSQESGKNTVLENADITVLNISRTSSFPFTITAKVATGGDLKFDGKAGPIPAGDSSKIPVQVTSKVQGLRLDPYGMGGVLSMDGKGVSDGQNLDWTGTVRIDQAKFSANGSPAKAPLTLELTLRHDLATHLGAITQGAFHVNRASAAFSGNYTTNSINMHVTAKAMPIPDLTLLLPALDIQLPAGASLQGGSLSADLAVTGAAAQPVVAGTIDLANTKLGGFNLGERMAVVERLVGIQLASDTDIEKLHTRLQAGPAGTALNDLDLVLPAMGELTGAGTVSPAHELNFKMRAILRPKGTVLAALGPGHDTAIPFFIQGTSANPVFRADTSAIALDQLDRLRGKTVGGVDTGKAVDAIKGIFGRKKQ